MESVELCARLARLASPAATDGDDARATLDDVIAFYGADVATVASVDDMILHALQRVLVTTVRGASDRVAHERAFVAVALLLRRSRERLAHARIVDLLQAAALYLPTPAAAIDPSTPATPPATPSEELVLAVLETLELLLSAPAADRAVQRLTHSQDSVHFLAYVVSSLLQLAERERHRGLAVQSIHVLARLLALVASDAHVVRMFFPGVSVGMWKAMSAPLQSSKVAAEALDCLASVVSACLGDQQQQTPTPSPFSLDRLRTLQHETSSAPTPTDAWVVEAADKVDVLLSHILSSNAMDRQHWRVRRALVRLCGVVVLDCRAALSASFFRCFEELMVLRTHALPDVAVAASDTLDRLTHALAPHEWLALEPRFAERFHMQLSTLELQCATERESVSAHTMEVLIGYLQFQKQRFRSVLDDAMPSIVKALATVLAFDGFDIELLRHERVADGLALPYFEKRFRHFHDDATVVVAVRLLRNLGAVATPAVVVDTAVLLLQTEEQAHDRAQRDTVLVILNECLRAHSAEDARDNVHLVGRVLDDLLNLPLWESTHTRDKDAIALLVESVGVGVDLCGRAFDEFLLYVLYPLVEKLGDHDATQVEQAALTTLQKIAVACGYRRDLHSLFSVNMDYFVDALCARLEQLELYPQAPHVVEALLRHATVASLPLVDEITRSLLRAVDLYQEAAETTTALLRSLQLLLASFAAEETAHDPEPETDETSPLTRFLLEMKAMTEPLESHDVEDPTAAPVHTDDTSLIKSAMPVEYDDADEGVADEEAEELPPLAFQTQTIEILERCSYFVADAEPTTCCLVLSTMGDGIRYLRSRRKELLPLIHRIWPSILHRLTVTNRPILTATMELVATLAECAGDFIGDRFVETVWPSVKRLLQSVAESGDRTHAITRSMLLLSTDDRNKSTDPAPARRVPLETKLLHATLRCLRVVCAHAVSVTSLVPEMTTSCAVFLSPSFGDATVTFAQELLIALAALNGDEVFVAMASLAQWTPPPPPSTRFPAFRYVPSTDDRHDDTKKQRANAAVVLDRVRRS